MPRKPQVNFRLKPEDNDGLSNIVLDFAYQKRRLRYGFGQSIKPKDWNEKKQRVKDKMPTDQTGFLKLSVIKSSMSI